MQTLEDFGYPVAWKWIGHAKAFYISERNFSVAEIKILMDAVQAANFITPEKSAALAAKLAALSGLHEAEILQSNVVCFNTKKHTNDEIYQIIETLECALLHKHRASFFYFDFNEKHERIYRKDKARYEIEPVALVYNNDRYYLMAISKDHEGITTYRLDRMEDVQESEEEVSRKAVVRKSKVNTHTETVFKMFSGKPENVTIEFEKPCMNSVFDKFGEDVKIRKTKNGTFLIKVPVQISPTFFSWAFQFAGQMWIRSPQSVVDEYLGKLNLCRIQKES